MYTGHYNILRMYVCMYGQISKPRLTVLPVCVWICPGLMNVHFLP